MTEKKPDNIPEEWEVGADSDTLDDPLLDCLEQLTKLHNRPSSRTALKAGLPLVNNLLTVELFPRAAKRANLSARVLKRPFEKITNLELPSVLLFKSHKVCIALKRDEEKEVLKVLLPETGMGEAEIPFNELEDLYTGYTIFVRPEFQFGEQPVDEISPRPMNWFWGTLFKSWRIYRDVFISSFLINLFGLATPFYIMNVYDRVLPNNAFETLWVLSAGILIIFVFELLLRGLRGYFIDEAGKKANLIISSMLFEKVLGLKMESRPKSVGAFAKHLQQFDSIRDFITSFSITAVIDLPFVLLGLIAIWYLAGKMVLVQLIAILIIVLYAFLVQIPLKKSVRKTFSASSQKNATLIEGLSGIETIKILGAESKVQRAWEESVSYIAQWSARSRLFSSSVNHLSNFIRKTTTVATVIAGVYLISNGELTRGGLFACIILSRRAIAPMYQVVNLATRYHQAKEALNTLNQIMKLPVERPTGKAFLHRSALEGAISLENVSFSYPGQSVEVLRDISLKISPGEHVAIIGATGSGKTTLGKLILGLYEPTAGLVSVDDTDIRQIDPAELRKFIGYVPQEITLFRGSLRDNIALGTYNVNDSDILQAAELAGATKFVKRHPKGFDLEIGEQGKGLSGGQKQSVALARAILLSPPILIMDEPSSSMDNRTELELKNNLKGILKGKTLLLITHRASLLDLVDRIIVIGEGIILADGPSNQVIEALRSGQLKT